MRRLKTDDRFLDWLELLASDVATVARLSEIAQRGPTEPEAGTLERAEREVKNLAAAIAARLQDTFAAPADPEDLFDVSAGLEAMAEFLVRAVERLKEFTGEREPDALSDLLAATTAAVRYAAECVRCLREPRSLLPRLDELKRHERRVRSAHDSLATSLVRADSDPMTAIKWTYVADQFLKTLGGYRRASSGLERIAMKQA